MPAVPDPPPAPWSPAPRLVARAVSWRRAFAWYEDAMRLVKRGLGTWAALAFITLATELALHALPGAGPAIGKIVGPLVACGLLYAAAAADSGAAPRLAHAIAAFRAPAGAMVAIVVAGALTFAAEAFAAWWIASVDLLSTDSTGDLSATAIGGIYAIGILASLPLTFVPFHVLFDRVGPGQAFAASFAGFAANVAPLLVYAGLSLVLLGFGLVTMGVGLVIVLPLWAASSYAAWKDVFGVE